MVMMMNEPEEVEISEEEINEALEALTTQEEPPEIWGPTSLRYFGPKTHAILVTGEIDEQRANALSSQIQELHLESPTAPIYVHINCPGGSIIDALAIYDMLMCMSNPIITIVNGGCFSAALLIACAGDQRLATPNSMYFYHQPTLQMIGIDSMPVMKSNTEFYEWCKENTDSIIKDRIDMTDEEWQETFGDKTSLYFNVETAIEHGFCTAVLAYAEKPEFEFAKPEEECES